MIAPPGNPNDILQFLQPDKLQYIKVVSTFTAQESGALQEE